MLLDLTTEAVAQLAFVALGLAALYEIHPDAPLLRPIAVVVAILIAIVAFAALFAERSVRFVAPSRAAIRRRFPDADVRAIDTVCQPTKDRQEAMRRLVEETEVVVVVGGPDSNNSRKLTEFARSRGRTAYQVARASELRPEWFAGVQVVGLTAGTSTPDDVIDEVRAWLEAQ